MSYTNNTKAHKKQVAKWDRLIKKWGHLDEALDELYNEGDERHGVGFTAYMDSIIVHRDQRDRDRDFDRYQEPNGYQLLTESIPKSPTNTKPMSFLDIMKEQENQKNQ
tara:strand:+ start:24 stop:347 length:324 start_codon:yes stop_codon:yes gene_type:complete